MLSEKDNQNIDELKETLRLLKESNKKLYSSMKAFQIAAEETSSLVFTYDTKKQTIFVDERTAAAFQVATVQEGVPYEMVKRGIVSEDTREEYIHIHEAIINGEKEAGGIVKLVPPGAQEIIYDLKFRSILDEMGNPTGMAVGIYRDITQRFLKEHEMERYQHLVNASQHFTYQYLAQEDVLLVFPSQAVEGALKDKTFRYEDYTGRMARGLVCTHEDIPIMQSLFLEGARKPLQVRLYSTVTGKLRWYAVTGKVVWEKGSDRQVFGTIADINDIKEREKKYRKLERVLTGMQDNYIGIFEVDLAKDTYITLACAPDGPTDLPETGGYTETAKHFSKHLVAAEYRDMFEKMGSVEYLREALKKERRIEVEYMTNCKDRVWRRNTYQAEEYKDGIPQKVILFQLDIDQQKAEKLMQQQTILEACNYAEAANAAKTEFLSRMSHDIRTPMNGIIGMTAIAAANINDPKRVSECLTKISKASQHLLSLINDVLDMSKIESGKMELNVEEFNLGELIDNMINMVLPQIKEHNHNLQVSVGDIRHEWVVGDSLRIQQVFINLVSNAVKYTPDGGNIKIRVTERPIKNAQYGEYEFIFEDNGIGMSEEFQRTLFEPFARAEDSRVSKVTGTGLGMAITRNIIRMMDGDIQVESKLNEGSRFTAVIHLELQERAAEQALELSGLPILVVDDDEITCENACLILNEIGMKSEWCMSGQEAVERICRRQEENNGYCAVIVDWKMPQMNGIDTVREIRRRVGEELPLLISSANDWSEIEKDAQAAGVNKFISKPLFKSRLVTCLKEALSKEAQKVSDEKVYPEEVTFEGRHILLAEDNELNAEIAQEILEATGASVTWARNGQEALERLKQSQEGYFHMIFMDVQMPVLNGYEATAAIRGLKRQDAQSLPIVAMTANAFLEDVNNALNAGMNEHISKPVDFEELKAVMRKYL